MHYQLKEKPVYSEADAIFFASIDSYGEIINTHFKDYTGISVGAVIYQSEDQEKVQALKVQLEILRLKTINQGDGIFYFVQELVPEFLVAENIASLQTFYREAFQLDLVYEKAELRIGKDQLFIPAQASDAQIEALQKILNLYFYEVIATEAGQALRASVDWEQRLAMLMTSKNAAEAQQEKTVAEQSQPQIKASKTVATTKGVVPKSRKKPWWKFW